MQMKDSHVVLGELTDRWLRFRAQRERAGQISDFDEGRAHQIAVTIGIITDRPLSQVFVTLHELYAKQGS